MNYPNGIKKHQNVDISTKPVDYKNRGMTLEGEINQSNEYYIEIGKAFIYKKPTPIKIVNVDFPSKNKAVIKEAYFSTPSTTDYNGLYKGKYIDFEAKETKSETAFALTNIHPHQIKHLENIDNNGGIAFIIVRFTTLNETYLITAERFLNYINNNDKKSVPLEYFRTDAYLIKDGYRPRIDYLKVVDILIGGKI